MNLLDAIDDENLFGPHFTGTSWDAWKVFIAALFALPMNDAALAVYQRHTGRSALPGAPFTEAALIVGRRGGKSRILALIATYLATFRDYERYLAPGELATVAVIAADRRQAKVIFRYISGLMRAVPLLATMIDGETYWVITLTNRVVIEVHTASFRVTRGYSFAAVLADETAFWRNDETSANPDAEIFRALRPGMASIPGAILLNASSPYRRQGELWKTFQRHHGKDDARVLVWQAATLEMNSSIDPAVVTEAIEDDPESAASEYGAAFRSDIADFVSRGVVEACIEPGVYERPYISRVRSYTAFIDAAGGSGTDAMTLAIAHTENDIPMLDAIRERRPPFSPEDAVAEFVALLKSYRIHQAESDRWGGDWVGESFRKHGVTVTPSARPKGEIYIELLPMLNARRASLLDHSKLVSQLCGLERRTSRAGKDSIDHAPGGHDDLANAVAGALLRAKSHQPMRISLAAIEAARTAPRRAQLTDH